MSLNTREKKLHSSEAAMAAASTARLTARGVVEAAAVAAAMTAASVLRALLPPLLILLHGRSRRSEQTLSVVRIIDCRLNV